LIQTGSIDRKPSAWSFDSWSYRSGRATDESGAAVITAAQDRPMINPFCRGSGIYSPMPLQTPTIGYLWFWRSMT